MKLLTQKIRKSLPKLRAQEGKGADAIVSLKFFTPDSNWTWWVTEGEPVFEDDDPTKTEIDFEFFGLVEGFEREFGHFRLSELQGARGPMGLAIERDLYWNPKSLGEIAPEKFE